MELDMTMHVNPMSRRLIPLVSVTVPGSSVSAVLSPCERQQQRLLGNGRSQEEQRRVMDEAANGKGPIRKGQKGSLAVRRKRSVVR